MDRVKIFYNGEDVFGDQPTPFISIAEAPIFYASRWGLVETFSLEGLITGCTFSGLIAGYNNVVNKFNTDYKTLEIWQFTGADSGIVFRRELAEITDITIGGDKWVGALPYTIIIRNYPSGYFSGDNHIIAPNNSWSFVENEDYTATITHVISCKGLNTSSTANNALENAKAWVLAKTGGLEVLPAFIRTGNFNNLCLRGHSESINRFNGEYSVTQTYINDLARLGPGILRYSTDFQSGDYITATIDGEVTSCENSLETARQIYKSFNPYATALSAYNKLFGRTDLNSFAITSGIRENPINGNLSFSITFDNDLTPDVIFDYTTQIQSGTKITVNIEGQIRARGPLKDRFEKVSGYASLIDLYALSNEHYVDFYPLAATYPLNTKALSSGRSENIYNGTINLRASFDNSLKIDDRLGYVDYTISFNPPTEKLDMQPCVGSTGAYSVVGLGYKNRAGITLQGRTTIPDNVTASDGLAALYGFSNRIITQYGRNVNLTLDVNNVSKVNNDAKSLSFTFSWSFDSLNCVTNSANKNTISEFRVN